ncbi:hypothetical protein V6N11_010654 [Hibiscus sabdariffa]|uniref:GAG-pre-integrase domain-containing protein n=1 Tax=Hibiscus sabdariffa TaxID=183260 RepID=A0ABR2S5W2_9ROSI
MGVKFDDEILGFWLLATLLDSWETIRVSFINYAPPSIITLDLAKSGVLNEEVRRRSQGSTLHSEVLVTENMGEIEKKMAMVEIKAEASPDQDIRILSIIIVEKSERVVVVTHEDLLVICYENLVNLTCDDTSWVIDTSASIHVTSRRDFFTSYTHGDFGALKLGKLDDEGFYNIFSDGKWKLTKGSLVVAQGKKSSNLYLMQASNSRDTMNVTVNDSSTELWHKRLSHMSENGLNCVAKTIDDIDKTEKEDSPDSGNLTDVNLVPLNPSPNPIQDDVHGGVNDDQHDIGDFDALIDDVVNDQQQAPIVPPVVPLRRSSRDRRSFVKYSSDDYVLSTDEGEHECYEENLQVEALVE